MDINDVIADLDELERRLRSFVERTRNEHGEVAEFRKNQGLIRERLATAIKTVDDLIRDGKPEKKAQKTKKKTKPADAQV